MASRNKPYDQFGNYILFKKLEADSLTDLWRAARLENGAAGPTLALRRFSGGNREALSAAAWSARQILPSLSGTSFVRGQMVDAVDGVPFIAYEYAGGRSLRHIVDRARGGTGATPNPIPIDQAIAIAERVALSIATTEELRSGGDRLTHSALIPQFVWISDDGEIRVAGQQLGRGIVTSLSDARIAAEIGPYFAPEYRQSGISTKTSEVFALGAITFLAITGEEPPDAANAATFAQSIRAAKTMAGAPMPDEIRAILTKSLALEPSSRYASVADMKAALSALANSGKYAANTFNLAFYLSTLLRKEMDGDAIDREREAKVNLAPYFAPAPVPVAAAPIVAVPPPPPVVTPAAPPKKKSKMPLAIAATAALAMVGAGAWFALGQKRPVARATSTTALASTVGTPIPAPRPVIAEPLVASATPETSTSAGMAGSVAPAGLDDTASKKAFEDAVRKKLEEEVLKLQAAHTRRLQQQQSSNAPIPRPAPSAAVSQQAEENSAPSASELDQQRLRARQAEALAQSPAVTQPQQEPASPVTQAPAAAVVQTLGVREGDVVDGETLDAQPRVIRKAQPVYPAMAARQKITGTVLVSALVSETGDVLEVKILKGEGRLGFDEAAVRAVKATKFSPPMKEGKRVRTWVGIPIQFK
jgi:TonB family protein